MKVIKSLIKYGLVAAASISLYAYTNEQSVFQYTSVNVPNSCMVDSVVFANEYKAAMRLSMSGVWTRIVCFSYTDPNGVKRGHAICVFMVKGYYYFYDPYVGTFGKVQGDQANIREVLTRVLPMQALHISIDDIIIP